jgi:hypothetical protein
MLNEAFVWGTRIKAVEREYDVARLAVDRLAQHTREKPEILNADFRYRDIGMVVQRLEGTYLLRLFAEFEMALRHFLRALKIKIPKNAEPLIDKVRDKAHIARDDALKAHAVRQYRNNLIHDDSEPAPTVSIREATRDLGTFLGWLQRYW